jgi:hypothetical protein
MRISNVTPRGVLAAALLALLFGVAPGAAAQDLVPVVGAPIAYRVEVPDQGWTRSGDDGMLTVGRNDAMIIVSVMDLATLQQRPASVSESQYRTTLTQRFMASDSVMMALMTRVVSRAPALEREGLVQEARTLGGQRAAYIRDRQVQNGTTRWRQAYLTVKGGIMYMLVFVVQDTDPDKYKVRGPRPPFLRARGNGEVGGRGEEQRAEGVRAAAGGDRGGAARGRVNPNGAPVLASRSDFSSFNEHPFSVVEAEHRPQPASRDSAGSPDLRCAAGSSRGHADRSAPASRFLASASYPSCAGSRPEIQAPRTQSFGHLTHK